MKEKILFVQFSDELLTPESYMRDYYRAAYSQMPGYHFPQHFMEIPFWIPRISGMLDSRYEQEVLVATSLEDTVQQINSGSYGHALFSVMAANLEQVLHVAKNTSVNLILGGYTNPNDFRRFAHANYVDMTDLPNFLNVNLEAVPNYELFRGLSCIPRITLSQGCLFQCTFCTVPTELTTVSEKYIGSQAASFEPLDFQLIFVDDKSFGQAGNYKSVERVAEIVRSYNPVFNGFIVQTPPSLAVQPGFLDELERLKVKYLETGVETVNNKLLEGLQRPYRIHHLEKLCNEIRTRGNIKIIPNLIMGIPRDDYQATIEWVARNRDIIPVVNVNYFSVHHGAERGVSLVAYRKPEDADQNSPNKSWLSTTEKDRMMDAVRQIYSLTAAKPELFRTYQIKTLSETSPTR